MISARSLFNHVVILFALGCLLAARPAEATESPWKSPFAQQYDPRVDAAVELQRALRFAHETDRLLLLVVGGDWCSWCFTLDRHFSRREEERESLERTFVLFKLYYENGHPNGAILDRFPRIRRYPHFLVFDPLVGYVGGQATGVLERRRKIRAEAYDSARVQRFVEGWETYRVERLAELSPAG